jgi:hypothetical protein
MIAKTFFLAKIIHRILTRSLRGKKCLHENPAGYRIFFARPPGFAEASRHHQSAITSAMSAG